jgi:hypothetical protein
MDQELAILYPDPQGGDTAKLKWHRPQGESHAIPDLEGFDYINLDEPEAEQFMTCFEASDSQYRLMSRLPAALGLPEEALKRSAICESFETRSNGIQINPYSKLELNGHSHFVQARGLRGLYPLSKGQNVHFITGSCLFSNRMLTARSDDGSFAQLLHPALTVTRPLVSLEARPELSFYELETCARQARLVADLAGPALQNGSYDITIALPREQYYCYLLEALDKGLIDREMMKRWIKLVDERYDQIVACLEQQLRDWTTRLGLPSPVIRKPVSLPQLRELLLQAVEDKRLPSTAELMQNLGSHDQIWTEVNRLMPPQSLRELINYTYSVGLLQTAGPEPASDLLIDVEDRSETRIYETAKQMRGLLWPNSSPHRGPALMGLYALEQAFIANARNWSLYLNDPGTRFDDGSQVYSSRELLGKLYG